MSAIVDEDQIRNMRGCGDSLSATGLACSLNGDQIIHHFTLRSHRGYDGAVVRMDHKTPGVSGEALSPIELVEGRDLEWNVGDDMMRVVVRITAGEMGVLALMDQEGR